ncbi:hypothetical protein B0T24DRAFT_720234 [Lasiosphaeria ovina]|uniref:Uncharacterized protein n=1 Tax=Lasiosphaeria ovina TaxID=92902 RepID=A0AAE0N7W7_9PEZI|nr:hypothetical protein B0T24DRAFT_720234 [Lasiosphaeria ovina]
MQASHAQVGKPRAPTQPKSRRHQLPAWFHRVALKRRTSGCDYSSDFDEDISDLEEDTGMDDDERGNKEEQTKKRKIADCDSEDVDDRGREEEQKKKKVKDCDSEDCDDMDCDSESGPGPGSESESESDDDDDSGSEASYTGSYAGYYYELKEEREYRKKEMVEELKKKDEILGGERTKEEEVRAAYESLAEAEKEDKAIPRIESLEGRKFTLFCADYVNRNYNRHRLTKKWVKFREVFRDEEDEAGELYGTLMVDKYKYRFGPCRLPHRASTEEALKMELDGSRSRFELSVTFVSNDYLKVRVSRYTSNPAFPRLPTAPKVYEFAGVWRDKEKERAERKAREFSPKESWFELNHPMGAYYHPDGAGF